MNGPATLPAELMERVLPMLKVALALPRDRPATRFVCSDDIYEITYKWDGRRVISDPSLPGYAKASVKFQWHVRPYDMAERAAQMEGFSADLAYLVRDTLGLDPQARMIVSHMPLIVEVEWLMPLASEVEAA